MPADNATELEKLGKSIATMHRDIDLAQRDFEKAKKEDRKFLGQLKRALFGHSNSKLWNMAVMEVDLKQRQSELANLTDEFNKRQAIESKRKAMEEASQAALDTITRGTRKNVTAMRLIRFKTKEISSV